MLFSTVKFFEHFFFSFNNNLKNKKIINKKKLTIEVFLQNGLRKINQKWGFRFSMKLPYFLLISECSPNEDLLIILTNYATFLLKHIEESSCKSRPFNSCSKLQNSLSHSLVSVKYKQQQKQQQQQQQQ